jgi:formimidoylglutamate deiminase
MPFEETRALETGWLADFIYRSGRFESGLAMMVDPQGRITRFSREPDDLSCAQRLPRRAIVPGLVNAHSHAFQRAIRGRTEHRTAIRRDTFWTWREGMYRAANRLSPEALYHAARMAFMEMVLSGITTVGEFHYVHHAPGGAAYPERNHLALQVLRAARETGLRIALLRTAYARAGWQKPADAGQVRFLTPRAADFLADTDSLRTAVSAQLRPDRAWVGVAPHSLRAVPIDYLREVAGYAHAADLPLHMHVAEQPAEVEACLGEYSARPVELLARHGILSPRFTAVHAVHITAEEMRLLGDSQVTVCACPTTERNLGDGAVPADGLFETGVSIALGSDSNVQIDLLEDARLLEYDLRVQKLERLVLTPDASPGALARRLFSSATEAGARSLSAPGGTLEAGRPADFFTVDLDDPSLAGAGRDTLLDHIVFSLSRTAVRDVCVDGQFVVRDGRHPLQDEIVREFATVQAELWRASE